ncbi:MAG: hypothetical protein ABRQ26_10465 [Syntrophomonadaceae bacterium]
MIVTPEQFIKQYFPEPIETTRELYDRLELEKVYPYLDWLSGAERHCLSQFAKEVDYRLLPDAEKNYWIGEKVFWTLIQSSPSRICDQIRKGLQEIAGKVATDREYARQYREMLDQEYGIEKIEPKVSKKLKAEYNETGRDAFEFSHLADDRLHLNIISGHDFKPGQKINYAVFKFILEVENGVPFHIIEFVVALTNEEFISYRTIWNCSDKRLNYGVILRNGGLRVNLFGDNRKLVDSYEYALAPTERKKLVGELEEVIKMVADLKMDETQVEKLGAKILNRYNLDGQAYALAIKDVLPTIPDYKAKGSAEKIEAAYKDAVDKYWQCYVLQPDPSRGYVNDLEQMIKDRMPRVLLAAVAATMINYGELCERYFKRSFSSRQMMLLSKDAIPRFLSALTAADQFDQAATLENRIEDMGAFIAKQLDSMQEILAAMNQWPK